MPSCRRRRATATRSARGRTSSPARPTPTSPTARAGRTSVNTPFREYKHWVHEGGISTPLIAHWPAGITARGELRTAARAPDRRHGDLPRRGRRGVSRSTPGRETVSPEGRSLLPAFAGRPVERDALYWEHEGNRAVREGDWKLVAKGPGGPWELYDLAADRIESKDLAAQRPEVADRLRRKWEAWARRTGVLPWIWRPAYGTAPGPAEADSPEPPSRAARPRAVLPPGSVSRSKARDSESRG